MRGGGTRSACEAAHGDVDVKRLVIDLDETLTAPGGTGDYSAREPNLAVVERLREYSLQGFAVIVYTARNMRTYENSVGKINAFTLPVIIEWLKQHDVPFDEVHVGKPWCGTEGFYVDDRAVRPSEFVSMSLEEIQRLVRRGSP